MAVAQPGQEHIPTLVQPTPTPIVQHAHFISQLQSAIRGQISTEPSRTAGAEHRVRQTGAAHVRQLRSDRERPRSHIPQPWSNDATTVVVTAGQQIPLVGFAGRVRWTAAATATTATTAAATIATADGAQTRVRQRGGRAVTGIVERIAGRLQRTIGRVQPVDQQGARDTVAGVPTVVAAAETGAGQAAQVP